MTRDVEYYRAYVGDALLEQLAREARPAGPAGLAVVGEEAARIEAQALELVCELYERVKARLAGVLAQRSKDREFVDQRTRASADLNRKFGRGPGHPFRASVFGQRDAEGRVVVGPSGEDGGAFAKPNGAPVAPLPDFLRGPHVTLFGLAESADVCAAAMACKEARLPGEPAIVGELAAANPQAVPRWGVDAEDSQTPLAATFVGANDELAATLRGAAAQAPDAVQAFKRLPGIGLPSTFALLRGNPLPLHLVDLAVHLSRHWDKPRALVFYMPKLENEEEAAYLHELVRTAEELVQARHSAYKAGSVRVLVVLESARAIFRANEIMDALAPYFAGASLGWHDFLASTARLYKEDATYRIPVKADPGIVVKHVKASHELVAQVVGGRGGIAIGGMYGVLPTGPEGDTASGSFQVVLRGFVRDVLTQLKRGLNGFWVARPDFVRLGLALVEAWRRLREGSDIKPLEAVVRGVVRDAAAQEQLLALAQAPDVEGLRPEQAGFEQALVVADVAQSGHVANNDPEEVRYNVFQTLQYLADWLAGNGCVALPGLIDGQPVRIMDDLATVERSRWEVWHEVRHGRFSVEALVKIAHEELNFIRRDLSTASKIVQVKWDARSAKWYPVAMELLLKLMTDRAPVEFVTELLLPLTAAPVWSAEEPLEALERLGEGAKFRLDAYVGRFHYFFERCGAMDFARAMAQTTVTDLRAVEAAIRSFDLAAVVEAASFHGDIGQSAATLDKMASAEQARVFQDAESVRAELKRLGAEYLAKFGVKFLVSAKGKSGAEMLAILKARLGNTAAQELDNAREALWEITRKRIEDRPADRLWETLEGLRRKHGVTGASMCISTRAGTASTVCLGEAVRGKAPVTEEWHFEIASLSKTVASAFAIEYFTARGISLEAPVNQLLDRAGSDFRLRHPEHGDRVQLRHLMSHAALNMHYVNGVPLDEEMPDTRDFLDGNERYGYPAIDVLGEPGSFFRYSGGGFLVLEHLIERMERRPVAEVTRPFLEQLGLADGLTFEHKPPAGARKVAHGYDDSGATIAGTRKMFPCFAAGALGTPRAVLRFLEHLAAAYQSTEGSGPISHDTAALMLRGTDKGCQEFMGCLMGIGVFVGEAGPNRFTIHQGANDGFRGVYLHCFDGPDAGAGMVVFANGDNRAMFFIAEAMQNLLLVLDVEGVDAALLQQLREQKIDIAAIPQEEIVNYGYKNMVFSAMQPTLPAGIDDRGPPDPLAPYNKMVGARVVRVTSQRFARVENLASDHLPKFDPELFCPMGKVMDSWETARHNEQACDEAVFELRAPAEVRFVHLSTKYHYGNQAEFVEVLGHRAGAPAGAWVTLAPKGRMDGHADKRVRVDDAVARGGAVDQVLVRIFPDGGLSRVGLFAELPAVEAARFAPAAAAVCEPSPDPIPATKKPLQLLYEPSAEEVRANLAALKPGDMYDATSLAFGGSLVSVTNQHYGPAGQVLSPYIPLSMHDGFESARSRTPGHVEELVVALGAPTRVERIELDFTFFVNNNPRSVAVLGLTPQDAWEPLVPETQVKPFAGNTKVFAVRTPRVVSQLKLLVLPDGGVNRLRAFGRFGDASRAGL